MRFSILLNVIGGCGILLVICAAMATSVALATGTGCTDGGGLAAGVNSGKVGGVMIYRCSAFRTDIVGDCQETVVGKACDSGNAKCACETAAISTGAACICDPPP